LPAFVWTKTADDIITRATRQPTKDARHERAWRSFKRRRSSSDSTKSRSASPPRCRSASSSGRARASTCLRDQPARADRNVSAALLHQVGRAAPRERLQRRAAMPDALPQAYVGSLMTES
jgi:hypothetical protein